MLNKSIKKRSDPAETTAAEPRRDLEAAILEAAERLFQQKGYARTSTTEIAREAGCNQALVHYYFRTKENLFESIFERKLRQLFGNVREIQEKDASFEERLAARIEAHFDILAANPGIPSMVMIELLTNPDRVRSLRERFGGIAMEMAGAWKREIDEAARKGTIRPIDFLDLFVTILALNVMPFVAGPILKQAAGFDDAGYMEILRKRRSENVRIVLASLRPDPQPSNEHVRKTASTAREKKGRAS